MSPFQTPGRVLQSGSPVPPEADPRVPDPAGVPSDPELRAHIERALTPHYDVESEIGRGGMGVVYRGKDRRLKRTVAIKVLPPELAFRSDIKTRFLREAETAAQLNHPNIVDIYSVDETEGLVYFVMAYIDGDNLAKRLHDHGALSIDETRRTLRDVADALAYAHERGVIHRDIKPDNILIDAKSGRPMVTDFGIARAVGDGDSRLTATGIAIGTPTYMSPEQASGDRQIDGRSDLYSLGVVAYQMLTSEPPFIANSTPAILVKHISERPTPIEQRRPDVPIELARIIMTMLEKDPANRFPSAAAVVTALDSGHMPERTSWGDGRPAVGIEPRPSRDVVASFAASPSNAPMPPMASSLSGIDEYAPTADEMNRWQNQRVQKFRRQIAPYLFVNAIIVIASIVSDHDYLTITVFWSIWLAFRYAKLWADGFDWRDVFQQPRDRELVDVAEEFIGSVRSLFDSRQRQAMREARRAKRTLRQSTPALAIPMVGAPVADAARAAAGAYADRVVSAARDRDEILRMLDRMPNADRSRIPDVGRSAQVLAERVQVLAISLADIDRSSPTDAAAIDGEIARLEGAANPLDVAASEERVRRLAFLRKQRRALGDVSQRRAAIAAKLDTCVFALQNMKIDLLRHTAGAQTHQHITSLAVDAMRLADSVDGALVAAEDANRGAGARPSSRSAAR